MNLVTVFCQGETEWQIIETDNTNYIQIIQTYITNNILKSILKDVASYDKDKFEFVPQLIKAAKPRVFIYSITSLESDKVDYFRTYKQEILEQIHSETNTKNLNVIKSWNDKKDQYFLVKYS
ncbi:hypothetical protein OX283_009280 [Flavobacterium sp. SUN052]|uniref:hypothetical protein n=1 Tax=Flavobacterium sp. SUN052 TaxID=3002441 RepID=UPI0023868D73|nr:hypothetical protein [Flavobacterium sp. SUN052]MEC4004845.1 hypothetical protein [Flavobacterium sp. SUN052]